MAVCYKPYSLSAICWLAVTLSSFVLQPEAQPTVLVQRGTDPEPAQSYKVKATHIPQTQEIGEAFALPVVVGTTRTYLHLDSGSERLWILSELMPKDQYRDKIKYDPGDKARCPAPAIGFDDGVKIEGEQVTDTVEPFPGKLKHEIPILASNKIEPDDPFVVNSVITGNIGFDFGKESWIKSAYLKGLINSVFEYDLQLSDPSVTISIDPKDVPSEVTWFPRVEAKLDEETDSWSFPQPGNPADQKGSWSFLSPGNVPYIVDSGATYINQPVDVAKQYFKDAKLEHIHEVSNEDSVWWVVWCRYKLPDFHFKIGDLDVTIPGADLQGPPDKQDKDWCIPNLLGYDNSPDEEDDLKNPYFSLGTPFMKYYEIYFDMAENGRIGFTKS